ncbi:MULTISPECIES: molybdopterin converting factor subunit 1 [Ramlibacter]|uniref:Molybdopterin synthase sulfur carrier subunit n=1 Tax=Ramlibacter aquaticus TaxID=2780094 RepID=A0ABR9SKM8_9BURK|nr:MULTISPECIES: molybdopterin converting factor subunit 1 [Ramlibacter]MBE7942704.1 molybdopterin converting factor subunit 1 [Ramlibacter aquaticus]
MKVRLKYFASIRERIGAPGETVDTTATTAGGLRDELIARGGAHAEALARGKAVRLALDQVMAGEDAALAEGCELAFFPPVTGG